MQRDISTAYNNFPILGMRQELMFLWTPLWLRYYEPRASELPVFCIKF